jgi:hypothetical protein
MFTRRWLCMQIVIIDFFLSNRFYSSVIIFAFSVYRKKEK